VVSLSLVALLACRGVELVGPPETALEFPADHGIHREAQTEWWYLQAVIRTDAGRELAVFLSTLRHDPRRDLLAGLPIPWSGDALLHWACVADLETGERVSERWTGGMSGMWAHHLQGAPGGWFSVQSRRWRTWGGGGRFSWEAPTDLGRLLLHATPTADPMPIGAIPAAPGAAATGRSSFEAAAFSYYTLPRVQVHGSLRRGSRAEAVSGEGWLDHQYGYIYSELYTGWWWVVLMLEDGTDLLLTQVTPRLEGVEVVHLGTVRRPGEPAEVVGAFSLTPEAMVDSPRSPAAYPSALRVSVPGEALALRLVPRWADSEWKVRPAPIWEGPVEVTGTRAGGPVRATGFAEFLQHGEVFGRRLYESGER